MKGKNVFILIIVVIVINIGGLYYFLNLRSLENQSVSKTQPKKKEFYLCPMHPQITSDNPEACSICGMDLVLQSHEENSGHGDHAHD